MSIRPMNKKCKNCGIFFIYDVSAGNMGIFCPNCQKPADIIFTGKKIDGESEHLSDKVTN